MTMKKIFIISCLFCLSFLPIEVDATESGESKSLIYYTPSFSLSDFGFGSNLGDSNITSDEKDETTLSLGVGYETMIGGAVISLGGGIEKANNQINNSSNCTEEDLQKKDDKGGSRILDSRIGDSLCGDELLSAIGMELSYENYTITSAFSNLTSTDADTNAWTVGFGSAIDDLDYTVAYTQESLNFVTNNSTGENTGDKSTILTLDATKPLNENLDLGLSLSSSDIDIVSQTEKETSSAWQAGVSLSFGF